MDALLLLFLIPMIASLLLFCLPLHSLKILKGLAFILSLIPLVLLIVGNTQWIGTQVNYAWLPALSINFHLVVDELSLLFLFLTAFIIPISLFAVSEANLKFPNVYYGFILLVQGLLIGFFVSRDLVIFTFFWEAMLLPLYFIISLWGGVKKQNAAIKFLIYMFAGSVLMIVAILALYFTSPIHSFDMNSLGQIAQSVPYAPWLFAIFCLAFAVKTPLFPFHAWLPDAYYEAPLSGSILLSALLSKAGIYGFLRIGHGFFPDLMESWGYLLIGLAVIGVFYAGLSAWREGDFKRLVAYSSLSHVNFILAGVFAGSVTAHSGALLQVLNHGVTVTGLFLVTGWLSDRLGTTAIGHVGGLAKFLPYLCWVTLFFVLSNVALPGMNNFIGEFLILFGIFGLNPWLAAFLALTVILSVMYMLRFMQKVYFEAPTFFKETWVDIRANEMAMALPLIAVILWIGIFPLHILEQTERATSQPQQMISMRDIHE